MRDTGRGAVGLLLLALALSACKPPRSPREQVGESIGGSWTAQSARPGGAEVIAWSLRLEERAAGRVRGTGRMIGDGAAHDFPLSGVRGESEVTLHFDLPEGRVRYRGSIPDPHTLTGELQHPAGTVPIAFSRR